MRAYAEAPAISLDYAIAEKADKLSACLSATPWSDVGSWSEIWNFMEKDQSGNVVQGEGKIILQNSSNSLPIPIMRVLLSLASTIWWWWRWATRCSSPSKDQAEAIKTVVDHLKGNGQDIALQHDRVHRPWGWYQGLNRGERYQVKCLMVKPGGRLSLQSHHHRSEHWVVVKGTLEVTKGEETSFLTENQSTYIAIGEKHRLANPGKIPAYLIEVQSGAYLDEDDIVRFEDIYRRGPGE